LVFNDNKIKQNANKNYPEGGNKTDLNNLTRLERNKQQENTVYIQRPGTGLKTQGE